jgi:alpha-tubulin suppressor-like RCC1 family protein
MQFIVARTEGTKLTRMRVLLSRFHAALTTPSRNQGRVCTWAACSFLITVLACGEESANAPQPIVTGKQPVHMEDAGDDAGAEPEAKACETARDCDNGKFCDGEERCEQGRCAAAAAPPCDAIKCGEEGRRCDCDMDNDGLVAWFCGGPDDDADGDHVSASTMFGGLDCDDTDPRRFTGNLETCDYQGHDEDCDPTTVGRAHAADDPLADRDGDGYIDVRCINIDPVTHVTFHAAAADCDDSIFEIHPGPDSQDFCDGFDNDCDGRTDEVEGSNVDRSAQREYCRDEDGDGSGSSSQRVRACGAPVGFVPCRPDLQPDCNDSERASFPGNPELCDGIDNDCDGTVDDPTNTGLIVVGRPTFDDGTTATCEDGHWQLTCAAHRLWCDKRTALNGCETDATRLSSCGACQTACSFSCGDSGCDEVVNLALGDEHSCALTREGHVACWGRGADGQLGNDDRRSAPQPQTVVGLEQASGVSAGSSHTCAIAGPERSVYCWGNNSHGQLGTRDSSESSAVPVGVGGVASSRMQDALRVAAGDQHSCAILAPGKVACWGEGLRGRLGDLSSTEGPLTPALVVRELMVQGELVYPDVDDAIEIGTGYRHSCLLTRTGGVQCWGDNDAGQLGDRRTVAFSHHAVPVATLDGVTRIAVGSFHTCALMQGRVYCWGQNGAGQLGRPASDTDDRPEPVPGLQDIVEIVAGYSSTCAIAKLGDVVCWGSLAQNLSPAATSPSPRTLELGPVSLLALGGHLCFSNPEAHVSCWGSDIYGQLGDGATSLATQAIPVSIKPLSGSKP